MFRKRFVKKVIKRFLFLVVIITGTAGVTDLYKSGEDGYVLGFLNELSDKIAGEEEEDLISYSIESVPEYSGGSYVVINNNIPSFSKEELESMPYEHYSELDYLGRCGPAEAMIAIKMMPKEKRGEIGMIKPSGWHTVKYDDIISDKYLYNRCHLIGYQLTGENANRKNLITGTRYLNVEGMLPWENKVADYIKETKDRVLYRVTPLFVGDNLVASGVHMEAQSVNSDKISFNIYVFNVQPGIIIDYSTGDSRIEQN